ncbi:MAG TPA: hypothetical protein PLC24_01030 [Myxococcota bacterium]|nr:hypothetical protein [Myxococcota bacterium]
MRSSVVRVYTCDGKPVTSKRVILEFVGGVTGAVATDGNGQAAIPHEAIGRATVYVAGERVGTINAPGIVTISLPHGRD